MKGLAYYGDRPIVRQALGKDTLDRCCGMNDARSSAAEPKSLVILWTGACPRWLVILRRRMEGFLKEQLHDRISQLDRVAAIRGQVVRMKNAAYQPTQITFHL